MAAVAKEINEPEGFTSETLKIEPSPSTVNNYDGWLYNAINGFTQKLSDKYGKDADLYVKISVKQHNCPKVKSDDIKNEFAAFISRIQNLLYDSIYKHFRTIDIPLEIIFDDEAEQTITIDIAKVVL